MRTLIFGTCYLYNRKFFKLLLKWYLLLEHFNSELDFLIVDSIAGQLSHQLWFRGRSDWRRCRPFDTKDPLSPGTYRPGEPDCGTGRNDYRFHQGDQREPTAEQKHQYQVKRNQKHIEQGVAEASRKELRDPLVIADRTHEIRSHTLSKTDGIPQA
jgi:hypothetical protein